MALKTALIVDDSKLARITLRKKLDKLGLEVTLAESAEQAIAIILENRPDIVFMDHLMPDMDGFEATQEIRSMPGFESLPIVMCSGKDHDTYLEEAQAIGANFTLIKPPTNDALDAIMQMDFNASAAVNDEAEEQLIADTVAEIDEMLISDDMEDDALISDDMEDDALISDDMEGDDLATEESILQEQEDASLLDDGLMLDLDADIPMLDVVEENPLGLGDSADIPVAEVELEALPVAEVTDFGESEDIPMAETMLDEVVDVEEALEPSTVEEVELVDSSVAPQNQVDIEQLVATSVAAAMADVTLQLNEKSAEILQKQQALEDQTSILAASISASSAEQGAVVEIDESAVQSIVEQVLESKSANITTAVDIDESVVQSMVEQVLEAKAADITAAISETLSTQFEALIDQRLENLPTPEVSAEGAESVDVESIVTEQLDQRLLEMTEKMAQMQQQLDASSAPDEAMMNEALMALQPMAEGESSALPTDVAEQLDALQAAQLQLQSKIGLPKMLSATAILLSLAALAGTAMVFLA